VRTEPGLRTLRSSRIGMEACPKVLSCEGQAIRRMALEIVPDLFDGVKLGRITWKPFDMEPRVLRQDPPDLGPL
jgi:hypothetical protein